MALAAGHGVIRTLKPVTHLLWPKGCIVRVPCATLFWEPDTKGGYKTKIKKPIKESVKEGMGMLGTEVGKFQEEMLRKMRMDVNLQILHGDFERVWQFDSQEAVDKWVLTSDKDHNEGKSTAQFSLSRNKTGIFHGHLDTEVPKDGIVKSAGYCNIKSPRNWKSFKRQIPYEWEDYTHLLMRVRGDGRPYQIVLGIDRYFDLQWNDQYQFPLFTRGGPYWQLAMIPFSKFFLSSKGRIQDKQESVVPQLRKISNMGITLFDGWPGNFQLEIDYIAVIYDQNHTEQFAYEMYQVSPMVHA